MKRLTALAIPLILFLAVTFVQKSNAQFQCTTGMEYNCPGHPAWQQRTLQGSRWCPYCGMQDNTMMGPMGYGTPGFFPSYYPSWYGYGAMAYPNFFYPSPWMGWGVDGGYYPGHGGGYAAKPNVYVEGKEGLSVKIQVQLSNDSTLLAAAPIHGNDGWKGRILKEGKLESKGSEYGYFYYDYRFDEKILQDQAGFCALRKDVIEKMAEGLNQAGFKDREIVDFVSHWSIKIPPMKRFCVFPQDQRTLDKAAKVQIEPKPKAFVRVQFIVIPEEGLKKYGSLFASEPKKAWDFVEQGKPGRIPAAAGQSDLIVREWGVGFLQGN
ncbi:MAG: hypothetical protein JNL01_07330 [Bdellovibrionales bacterium]|nr:hypothetical protein [Bdellovibrionales bacterium]